MHRRYISVSLLYGIGMGVKVILVMFRITSLCGVGISRPLFLYFLFAQFPSSLSIIELPEPPEESSCEPL